MQTIHVKYRMEIRLRFLAIGSINATKIFFLVSYSIAEKTSSNREEDIVMNHDMIPCHSTRLDSLVQKSRFTVPPVVVVVVEERTTKVVALYLHGFILH